MRRSLVFAAAVACALPAAPAAAQGIVDPTVPAKRDTEPVILTGKDFGRWSVPANQTVRLPLMDEVECPNGGCGEGSHSHYAKPEVDTANDAVQGVPTARLVGYRWTGKSFLAIPFQVDEQFTRYLNNEASGFSVYSGEDQHTTYAYDREGFRFTKDGPTSDPCRATQATPTATDPVKGLDSNDEVVFMASDAGAAAPATTATPKGIAELKRIEVDDPANPTAAPRFVYVGLAQAKGPRQIAATKGYVRYMRDATAGRFVHSESSYGNYGAAAKGIHCDPKTGAVVIDPETGKPAIEQRRPLDTATVATRRYRFRYDGRWLMTAINISPDRGKSYGPDVVDRWKARAFAQDPSSNTPCCGYEEEDTNWGGSSILLGEKAGPVRAIRETWGADSGTNVIRRETFYRDEMRQRSWLRVHVIPPADGIYAQWDFNAGRMTRFFNPKQPGGVPIDGRNDEAFGNLDDPCNDRFDANDTSALDQQYRSLYQELGTCELTGQLAAAADDDKLNPHLSIDPSDPTFSGANAALDWAVTAGPYGTIVDRISASVTDLTPGGAAQSVAAVPYYRDDACFDDGTGSDPGPELHPRHPDQEANTTAPDGSPRRCWRGEPLRANGDQRFWQGDIGTHGLHLLFLADSDNARQTVPLDEIVSEWRMVMLPGQRDGRTGEEYGRGFEKPLVASVQPG